MSLLNKAKNALSNIGEETIAEASFEKEPEPKAEKPPRVKRTKPKKAETAKEKKPRASRVKKEKPKDEYVEVDVAVEDTKFDTFRDNRKKGDREFLDYDDFHKKPVEDDDYDDYEDEVEVEEEVESDTDYIDGNSRGARVDYDFDVYDDSDNEDDDYDNEFSAYDENFSADDDLEELEEVVNVATYKDVLNRLNIDEKVVVPDNVMLDEDVNKVDFDYQAPHGFNVTQVKEFQRTAAYSLSALVKLLKKRNVDIIKLSEELAKETDNSEIIERSVRTAKKIQHDKNLEIAKRNKEIDRLKEIASSQAKELRISKSNRDKDSILMRDLQDNLENMNNYLEELKLMLKEKDNELSQQQEFIAEKDNYLKKKEEENKRLQVFNKDLKESVKIITEQREARERELKEQEEREIALKESQERQLKEKITAYESEEDESIIRDMVGVKNLVSDKEIAKEIQYTALQDEPVISLEDFEVASGDEEDTEPEVDSNDSAKVEVVNENDNDSASDSVIDSDNDDNNDSDSDNDSVSDESEESVEAEVSSDNDTVESEVEVENAEKSDIFARFEKELEKEKSVSETRDKATEDENDSTSVVVEDSTDDNDSVDNDTESETQEIVVEQESDEQGDDEEVENENSDTGIVNDVSIEDTGESKETVKTPAIKKVSRPQKPGGDDNSPVNTVDDVDSEKSVNNESSVDNENTAGKKEKPAAFNRNRDGAKKKVGLSELEDSMSSLLTETSAIDFEKDLSEESSQEMQEKNLLDEIIMINEEDSEDLDMDTLNSFLKES